MHIREPMMTALIFSFGKMVVTGAKSEDDSRRRLSVKKTLENNIYYQNSLLKR